MTITKITQQFLVSAQMASADASFAAAQGIKTIICNRPDNEATDQPSTQALEDAATDAGIDYLHIPVSSKLITDENVVEFADACNEAKGPILAFCRTGMRSIILWALAETASRDANSIIAKAKAAGYDLSKLRPRLEARATK